jgi:hypothetical protein
MGVEFPAHRAEVKQIPACRESVTIIRLRRGRSRTWDNPQEFSTLQFSVELSGIRWNR